jgi:hypothetical protein
MQHRIQIVENYLSLGQSPDGQSPDGQSPDGQKLLLYTAYIYIAAGIVFCLILVSLSIWSALDASLMQKWYKSAMFVLWTCIMMMQGFAHYKKLLLLRHYHWLKINGSGFQEDASSRTLQSLLQKKYTPGFILLFLLSLAAIYAAIYQWFASDKPNLFWWDYGVYLIPILLLLVSAIELTRLFSIRNNIANYQMQSQSTAQSVV